MGCKCKCQQAPVTQQSSQVVNQLTFPFDKRCPTGQHWSDTAQACVDNPTCPPGSVWDETLQTCVSSTSSDPGNPHPPNPPGVIAVTYNCVGGQCVDPRDGSGRFATLADCQANCFQPPPPICSPSPVVTIDPSSGTVVNFPCYVFLHSSRTDATIYYTTNGSVPAAASTPYTQPFIITTATLVRAVAIVNGCSAGAIASSTIAALADQGEFFDFICSTTDKAGVFGVFAANGSPDYNWHLKLILAAITTITRVEIYETDSRGVWITGQAWATNSPINPVEGPANFPVYPLVVFDDGNTPNVNYSFAHQRNSSYASLGSFAAGTYLWTLVGQPFQPLTSGYFKIKIFTGAGVVIQQTIQASCCEYPATCIGIFGSDLKIKDYTNNMFTSPTPDVGAVLCPSSDPDWAGIMYKVSPIQTNLPCQWGAGESSGIDRSINGVRLSSAQVSFNETNDRYELNIEFIQCVGGFDDNKFVQWSGELLCGNTPLGIYRVVSGSATQTPKFVVITNV